MTIGDRIKKRRKELGLSAEHVADLLGKDRSTIYRYENDDIENLPTTILEPLAKVLNTTPAHLMGWDESDYPKDIQTALSSKEAILLLNFNKLNELGKDEAIKRVDELTEIIKYTAADEDYLIPFAAHKKDGEFSQEDIDHDLQIMKDDKYWDK